MIYNLSSFEKLQLEHKKVTLTRKGLFSFGHLMLVLVIMASIAALLYAIPEMNMIFKIIAIGTLVFFPLPILSSLLSIEYWEIDLMNNSVNKTERIGNVFVRKSTTTWPKGSLFRYRIYYDSYERITAICVTAYHPEKGNEKELIRFFEKETFHEFRKIFNNNFPENKVLEWHD